MAKQSLASKAVKRLATTVMTTHHIDYNALDTFVQRELGFTGFEFACAQESSNDTSHEFTVDGEPMDSYAMGTIAELKAGKCPNYSGYRVMEYLCLMKHIDPGTYIVRVSW